jgi:hypothetical protein
LKKMFIAANVMTKDAAGLSEEEEEGEKKGETGGEGEGDGGEETVKK